MTTFIKNEGHREKENVSNSQNPHVCGISSCFDESLKNFLETWTVMVHQVKLWPCRIAALRSIGPNIDLEKLQKRHQTLILTFKRRQFYFSCFFSKITTSSQKLFFLLSLYRPIRTFFASSFSIPKKRFWENFYIATSNILLIYFGSLKFLLLYFLFEKNKNFQKHRTQVFFSFIKIVCQIFSLKLKYASIDIAN